MEIFRVGGCVRDAVMGRESHDIDFSVVMPEGSTFTDTVEAVKVLTGTDPFKVSPDTFTIRSRAPRGFMGTDPERAMTFDFVMARRESREKAPGTRKPLWVEAGTLHDDLARRDFTMNAIAQDADGGIIDPFGGFDDIRARTIRTVGNPFDRFGEDGLRVLRAVRFAVTLGFSIDTDTAEAIRQVRNTWRNDVPVDRVRDELNRATAVDTIETFRWLEFLTLTDSVFAGGVWAKLTTETPK